MSGDRAGKGFVDCRDRLYRRGLGGVEGWDQPIIPARLLIGLIEKRVLS